MKINQQISNKGKRSLSFFIDDLVISILIFLIFYDSLMSTININQIIFFLKDKLYVFMILKIIYHTFFTWQNGMTLGKMVLKIKIIDIETGEIPNFRNSFIRSILRIISESFFYIGFIYAYFNPLFQTFHDKFGKTVVVDV